MKYLILLAALIVAPLSYSATVTSKIKYVQVNPRGSTPNVVAIKFETPPTTLAECASDDRMIADLNTEGGKAALSIAMAAKAAGLSVYVGGNGDCTGNLENIGYIRLL